MSFLLRMMRGIWPWTLVHHFRPGGSIFIPIFKGCAMNRFKCQEINYRVKINDGSTIFPWHLVCDVSLFCESGVVIIEALSFVVKGAL